MKRILALTAFLGGCAVLSSSPASSTGSSAPVASAYEPMESLPPAAQKEDVPALSAGEVWVPGYYQPVAGTWIWHQGQPTQAKDGYKLVTASYREENGKVYFTPPRWRRADMQPKPTEMSAHN